MPRSYFADRMKEGKLEVVHSNSIAMGVDCPMRCVCSVCTASLHFRSCLLD